MAMGDFDAASEELAAAASGLDASREDLYNLGELEFAKGEIDAAAQWYERAATVDPGWGKPPFKLALVALNKGDMETAKQYFEKVLEVDPGLRRRNPGQGHARRAPVDSSSLRETGRGVIPALFVYGPACRSCLKEREGPR